MSTDAPDLARELRTVERARGGDHAAFVELYRHDAPPAWRLALALTADAERAADAVARAFARTLAPLKAGAVRTEVPFRLRLLTTTRQVVVDQATAAGAGASPTAPETDDTRAVRAVEVMRAFHQLPERWRTVLWLLVVEGTTTAAAAHVLGVAEADAEELAVRALAGLRTQWTRDRMAAGEDAPTAPEQLERQLQTVLPLPLDLFAITEGRWRAARVPTATPLLLPLPGGRQLPRWAERSLVATTAALIAIGITSALALDRDPDVRRARGETVAPATTSTTLGGDEVASAPLDADDDSTTDGGDRTTTTTAASSASRRSAHVAAQSVGGATSTTAPSSSSPTSTPPTGSSSPSTTQPPTSTTVAPLLEVVAGIGPALALSVGDQCTGVQVAGQAIGCKPDPDTGVSVEGSLLPGS